MKGCNYIKDRIDEADTPNLLSFEVTEHIAHCDHCKRFASERAALRMIVASSARVSAPVNFNAMLNARIAEVKTRSSFWWLTSPGYLRLGAATAGLVVMIFAAQYAGLFSGRSNPTSEPLAGSTIPMPSPNPDGLASPPRVLTPPLREPESASATTIASGALRTKRGGAAVGRVVPPGYLTVEDGGVVLVRGQNGEMDVQMPTVSVGAQPLLYVSGRQRAVRNVGTSF